VQVHVDADLRGPIRVARIGSGISNKTNRGVIGGVSVRVNRRHYRGQRRCFGGVLKGGYCGRVIAVRGRSSSRGREGGRFERVLRGLCDLERGLDDGRCGRSSRRVQTGLGSWLDNGLFYSWTSSYLASRVQVGIRVHRVHVVTDTQVHAHVETYPLCRVRIAPILQGIAGAGLILNIQKMSDRRRRTTC
jgi:hypothetical protein